MYQYALSGAAFLICSITDLKCRKVYKAVAAGYLLLALLGHFIGKTAVAEIAAGLLPGSVCVLLSWLSRQGLGYGDSILIAICGVSVGFWSCVAIIFTAFFFSGLWAVGLLVFRRAERKKEIPFVPFLLIAVILQWVGV